MTDLTINCPHCGAKMKDSSVRCGLCGLQRIDLTKYDFSGEPIFLIFKHEGKIVSQFCFPRVDIELEEYELVSNVVAGESKLAIRNTAMSMTTKFTFDAINANGHLCEFGRADE